MKPAAQTKLTKHMRCKEGCCPVESNLRLLAFGKKLLLGIKAQLPTASCIKMLSACGGFRAYISVTSRTLLNAYVMLIPSCLGVFALVSLGFVISVTVYE